MHFPGYHAEASVYRSAGQYRAVMTVGIPPVGRSCSSAAVGILAVGVDPSRPLCAHMRAEDLFCGASLLPL